MPAKNGSGNKKGFVGARRAGKGVIVTLVPNGKAVTKRYTRSRVRRTTKSADWLEDPATMDALMNAFRKAVKDAERSSRTHR